MTTEPAGDSVGWSGRDSRRLRHRVPAIETLGIVGVQALGDPFAAVVRSPPTIAPADRLSFCEGFARAADGNEYAWEVWTRDCLHPASAEVDTAICIARLALMPAHKPMDIIERDSGEGLRFTQVVVSEESFGADLLERLRTATADERALIFTAMPPASE